MTSSRKMMRRDKVTPTTAAMGTGSTITFQLTLIDNYITFIEGFEFP